MVSLGGIVVSDSIGLRGISLTRQLSRIFKKYAVHIGERTAEQIKYKNRRGLRAQNAKTMKVRGRCMKEGLPRDNNSSEMLEAMMEPISGIMEVLAGIERTPPELVPDIINNGITMTGGGSLLAGLDLLITDVTGIKTRVAKNPAHCVVNGCGRSLSKLAFWQERENVEDTLPLA